MSAGSLLIPCLTPLIAIDVVIDYPPPICKAALAIFFLSQGWAAPDQVTNPSVILDLRLLFCAQSSPLSSIFKCSPVSTHLTPFLSQHCGINHCHL